MTTTRLVRALDLVDDADLIRTYENWHKPGGVWRTVIGHIRAQGVIDMEIWRFADRMVMIMEVVDGFPLAAPIPPEIEEWETLMDRFQRRLDDDPSADKWKPMTRIFALREQSPD